MKRESKALWISTTSEQPWQKREVAAAAVDRPSLALNGNRGQRWWGAGGCFNELGWLALQELSAADREAAIADLFDPETGCRFNFCRLPIGASDYGAEWYSLNETDGDFAMESFSIERDRRILLPYIKSALALRPDMKLFASPWSPPTWMKRPRAHNHGRFVMEPRYLDAYALYFCKFIEAYAAEGVAIHQVHMQNEPASDQKFPSCVWRGAQMRDFIRDHLGPALAKEHPEVEVWLGTINCDEFNNYPLTVLSDPLARRYVRGMGLQWAGRYIIQQVHETWPELPLMQTENECGDGQNTWAYASHVFALMRQYIRNGVNAYIYWNMILAAGGESTWGWKQNSMITVDPQRGTFTRQPEFYVMKHLSHYVQPGATVMGVCGDWSGNALAFENPDGERVLLAHNPLSETRELTFGSEGGGLRIEMPPMSFHTLVVPASFSNNCCSMNP